MVSEAVGTSIDQQLREELGRLFKNNPESLAYVLNHPVSGATFSELKQRYEEEHIPKLLKEILTNYDEIKANKKIMRILRAVNINPAKSVSEMSEYRILEDPLEDMILANAIVLTCRGPKRQCPTSMRDTAKRAGLYRTVNKVGEILGKSLHYDPDKRIKSFLHNFQEVFGLDNKTSGIYLDVYRSDRSIIRPSRNQVTDAYAGGLLYYISKVTGLNLTERGIAEQIGTTEVGVRNNFKVIARRQKDLLYERKEPEMLATKFKDKLKVVIDLNENISRPSQLEVYEMNLKAVQYLLEHNHNENNPIYNWELNNELESQIWLYGSLSPIDLVVDTDVEKGGRFPDLNCKCYIDSQRKQKAETYVELMKEVVMMCRMLSLP